MMAELQRVMDGVPFPVNGNAGQVAMEDTIQATILTWMVPSNHMVAPHWSRKRDIQLRKLWREIDPIKVAVNTFVSKSVTIPLRVHARDRSVRRHVRQAAEAQDRLYRYSGLMRGWKLEFQKYAIDFLTQDNGAFMLVLGDGTASAPLLSVPLGVLQLDSQRCQRTGDPEFPVIYTHSNGKSYKLHYTRVIYTSNLPSPDYDLFGVGHSPFTCALDSAVELRDIYTYMQEKLGSRPKRQIVYAKTGTTLDRLREAFEYADDKMDSEGLKRFSKTVMLAPKNASGQLDIDLIDMAQTPDTFNRRDVSLIDISNIAAAFGLDLQDLSVNYGISVGSQRANEVQERKGRGKGVGQFLEDMQRQLNDKYLPAHLFCVFDNQDDQQDEQQAIIWDRRSTARQRDLTTGSTTVQVERARMLRTGEITEDEYNQMELVDGRLPTGVSVVSLFFSKDPLFAELLDFGAENITNPEVNDIQSVLDQIDEKEKLAYMALEVAPTKNITRKLFEALAALAHLRALYTGYEEEQAQLKAEEELRAQEGGGIPPLEAEQTGEEMAQI